MNEAELSGKLGALLKGFLIIARRKLEEYGEFDPFGAVMTDDMKITFIEAMDVPGDIPKGNRGNQLRRRIEDSIRMARREGDISCAVILYDAYIRPLEGGDSENALIGRFEEKGVQAADVIIKYELQGGHLELGEPIITEATHHLLPSDS